MILRGSGQTEERSWIRKSSDPAVNLTGKEEKMENSLKKMELCRDRMKDGCLICGASLEYLSDEIPMKCSICHKTEHSKTRCVHGHYVCDECHMRGMDSIFSFCMKSQSRDPVEILEGMMSLPFCHMHGPEHHVMVGAALLSACRNAGKKIDLEHSLLQIYRRGREVPGGSCGYWGACGAGISTGIFVSVLTFSSPLSEESWGISNLMTARALERIGRYGGPRCCKRNSYLALIEAVKLIKEYFDIPIEIKKIRCSRSSRNEQCLRKRCPFFRNADSGS